MGRQNEDAARRAIAIETGAAEYWLDQGCQPDVAHRLAFSLDDELVKALEARKDFLLEFGFLKRDFDIGAWMDRGRCRTRSRVRRDAQRVMT